MDGCRIAVIGATGAVGTVFLSILEERSFPATEVRLCASERSWGRKLTVLEEERTVEGATPELLADVDLVFVCAGSGVSREVGPLAVESGAVVVDKSSAFRMDPGVPLVIPEINGDDLESHNGIVSVPNCSTAPLAMALKPLSSVNAIKRVVVSTYQSVSGTGAAAVDELRVQSACALENGRTVPKEYPHQIAFNVLPHVETFEDNGYTTEEMKMVNETRKILHDPDLRISATCVRVPVMVGHSEAVHIDFEEPMGAGEVREVLSDAPGLTVVDDPTTNRYPMPIDAAGEDDVFVGRIRPGRVEPSRRGHVARHGQSSEGRRVERDPDRGGIAQQGASHGSREEGLAMVDFGRLLTAMVTPFDDEGELDYGQARRLASALVASGSDGLVIGGTTGESPSMSDDEKVRLFAEVKEEVGQRATVIAGTTDNNHRKSVELSREAEGVGVDGLLLTVPAYNKPPQEGLYQHFKAIAGATSLPGLLYNVPSRTSLNMEAETTLRLAEIDNVVGVKEASSDLVQITRIVDGAPDGFRVWSGNDDETFPIMCVGGHGIVSVASNIIGLQIKAMMGMVLEGDVERAAAEHRRLLPIFKALFWVTNPIPIKYAVARAGFEVGKPRLPMWEADEAFTSKFDPVMDDYEVDLPV